LAYRRLPVHKLKTNARELRLESGQKVYHLKDWHNLSHPERLGVIRQIAMMRGRDPRIAQLALKIFRKYKVRPRQYKQQAAAILKWVQDPKNIYYVNEPGERLQDPIYTIKVGHGDCDDQILALAAILESVGLPWKLVLSGRDQTTGQKIRYIEGDPIPANCTWAHIYGMVGDKPFRPATWYFTEPTVEGVPLGWDVIDGDESYLPEMARAQKHVGPAVIARLKAKPPGYKVARLPASAYRSPAYEAAYSGGPLFVAARTNNAIGAAVGASVAESIEGKSALDWGKIGAAVATGVAVSVGTQLILDWVRGTGMWDGSGSVVHRWQRTADYLSGSTFNLPSPLKPSPLKD
jgi:hypothetical protein